MYVIVTYDISEDRVNKVRKILKRYLNWVQNSVFEGEITESKLEKCKLELSFIIEKEIDSIYFYLIDNKYSFRKTTLGIEKDVTDNIY
ncbi:MAG: CRISPR-associated endonuclease Cas2 [Brevinematia bacterium]|jgi:CRISPR-associated protein Cas2|nr:MAG: CRISPR-associated endonuclease Cas2 [Dictyoglomus turgidum]